MKHWACHCSNKVTTNDAQETPPYCTRAQLGDPLHGPMTLLRADAPKAKALGPGCLGTDDCLCSHHARARRETTRRAEFSAAMKAEIDRRYQRLADGAVGQLLKAEAPPPCNHEAELKELAKLRREAGDEPRAALLADIEMARNQLDESRVEVTRQALRYAKLETIVGERDATIAELQREVGRQSLELRRSRR